MENDFTNAIDQLKNMLSSEDGEQQLSNLVNSISGVLGGGTSPSSGQNTQSNDSAHNQNGQNGGLNLNNLGGLLSGLGLGGSSQGGSSQGDNSNGGLNLDLILKAKNIYEKLSCQQDYKTDLLRAIKPFIKEERHEKLDMIIKLVGFTKLATVMEDIKGLL